MSIQQEDRRQSSSSLTPPAPPRSRSWRGTALAACLLTLAGVTVGALVIATLGSHRVVVRTTAAPFTSSGSSARDQNVSAVIAALRPSVVAISVVSPAGTALGSGVVIRSDGLILTADHVIKQAGSITVTLDDGRKSVGHVVGRARSRDLAVVQADRLRHLTPVTFGSAKQLVVGSDVLVIGNPVGFPGTVTRGIVSALHRSVPVMGDPSAPVDPLLGVPEQAAPTVLIRDAIQIDATIDPGSSGGAVIDLHGHVIGIVTTRASSDADTDLDTGPAFAIPSDLAWTTANRLAADR